MFLRSASFNMAMSAVGRPMFAGIGEKYVASSFRVHMSDVFTVGFVLFPNALPSSFKPRRSTGITVCTSVYLCRTEGTRLATDTAKDRCGRRNLEDPPGLARFCLEIVDLLTQRRSNDGA